jgi:tRNA A37 N6-isopentenylltransferase MiaA
MSKRHKPEEIVAKLRQVDVLTSQGQTVADAVRASRVTEVTYIVGARSTAGSGRTKCAGCRSWSSRTNV